MNRPSHFGPMVRSLEIFDHDGCFPWQDFGRILTVLPNLLRLCITRVTRRDAQGLLDLFSSAISLRLRELECRAMPLNASLIHLLDSHPQVRTLSIIGSHIEPGSFETSPGLRLIERFEASPCHNPLLLAQVLYHMTNLTHLTLGFVFKDYEEMRSERKREQLLDAFSRCGVNLISLSMQETPVRDKQPGQLSWILVDVIPRLPKLRRLELRQSLDAELVTTEEEDSEDETSSRRASPVAPEPEPLDPSTFEGLSMPAALEIFTFAAFGSVPDSFLRTSPASGIDGLSAYGWANAKVIVSLFPALTTFIYIEGHILHLFGRFRNGYCRYNGSRKWSTTSKNLDSDCLKS